MAGWRVLARGEPGYGVSRCPEGHIHVELEQGVINLRFDDSQFLAFARTVDAAASAIAGHKWTFGLRVDERLQRN